MEANFCEPRYNRDGKIVALADVVVAEGIIVKGFRVVRGEKGLFVSVPTRSFVAEGKTRFLPQVVFTSPEHRTKFLGALLEAYEKWSPQPERRASEASPEARSAAAVRSELASGGERASEERARTHGRSESRSTGLDRRITSASG